MADGTTPPAVVPPATSWTTGLDPELIGHAQTLGWAAKPADEAAREALKAHREARQYIGVPETHIIKLPTKTRLEDPAAWNPVYAKLGAPADAKEYDFSTVKFKDGTDLDPAFIEAARRASAKVHASKADAVEIAREMVTFVESSEATDAVSTQAEVLAEKSKLRESWGKNYDSFEVVAKRTAEVLGVDATAINALEGQVGYAATMKMFHTIGTKIGEDGFIRNLPGAAGGNGAITKEQAVARKSELMGDPEWSKRYLAGGAAEEREFQDLIRIERANN